MVASATKTAQVTCINKADRFSFYESITHIGGTGWKITVEEAVQKIEVEGWTLFTLVNDSQALIGVRTSASGRKYVQTYANDSWNDNLLALPICW